MADIAPMYIGSLFFENYRLFEGKSELSLTDEKGHLRQWTVFLGNNNTGKTNLLKAIADLEPQLDIYIDRNSEEFTDFVPLNMLRERDTDRVRGKSGSCGCNIVIDNNKNLGSLLEAKSGVSATNYFANTVFEPFRDAWMYEEDDMWSSEDDERIIALKIFGYGVARRAGNVGISEKGREMNAASLFSPEHRLTNIEEWLFQLDYASKNGQKAAKDRLNLLKKIIKSEILPEIDDFRFTTSDELKNYIQYRTKDGWYLFEELGYGYQTTISWIIDFCKKMFERYPDSKNPLKEPAVLLVDELDLHLHPKWQKEIATYLSNIFPATQFIITTHSPLILQGIENMNLFVLSKNEKSTKIQSVPFHSLQGWSVEEILSEILEMGEGIFSDKHNELYQKFETALNEDDYEGAQKIYDELMSILHPNSPERKILKLQLSQIAPVDDKA